MSEEKITGYYADYIVMDDYLPPELTMLKLILWATGFEACYYRSDFEKLGLAVGETKREFSKLFIPSLEYLMKPFRKWGI